MSSPYLFSLSLTIYIISSLHALLLSTHTIYIYTLILHGIYICFAYNLHIFICFHISKSKTQLNLYSNINIKSNVPSSYIIQFIIDVFPLKYCCSHTCTPTPKQYNSNLHTLSLFFNNFTTFIITQIYPDIIQHDQTTSTYIQTNPHRHRHHL